MASNAVTQSVCKMLQHGEDRKAFARFAAVSVPPKEFVDEWARQNLPASVLSASIPPYIEKQIQTNATKAWAEQKDSWWTPTGEACKAKQVKKG